MAETKSNSITIQPQPGPQTKFFESEADIVIFGGAAGGGKSWVLLAEPIRHFHDKHFNSVIFRRTTPQIKRAGGLFDKASELYIPLGGVPASLRFEFSSGMTVEFSHLESEKDKYDWQGTEIVYIGFDELTHFSEGQFFYLLSRNRSTSGIKPYIRATCNPDPDSWVRHFIDWWIGDDGLPIPERDGVIRWFKREDNNIIWFDEKIDDDCKSVTFIRSKLEDNQILMKQDPGYVANLKALPYVERMQLLGGNWNVKPAAGLYFKPQYFEIIDEMPTNIEASVRYWDRASSEKEGAAYTAGTHMHRTSDKQYIISDMNRFQGTPLKVRTNIKNAAFADTKKTVIGIEQDPGQAGVVEAEDYVRLLAGFTVKLNRVATDKIARASPFSSQCEAGNVKLLRGPWNKAFIDELAGFPELKLKDQVDSASGAFNLLTNAAGEFKKNDAKKGGSKLVRNEDYD